MATCKASGLKVKMEGSEGSTTFVCTTKTGKEVHLSVKDNGRVLVHFADEVACHNSAVEALENDESFQHIIFTKSRRA